MEKLLKAWHWLNLGFDSDAPYWHCSVSWTAAVIISLLLIVMTVIVVSWFPTGVQLFILILTFCVIAGTFLAAMSRIW